MALSLVSALSVLLLGPLDGDAWRPDELKVAERAPVTDFDELQSIAFRYLGRPYVMGGVGSPGLDCSGFTCRVFAEAGYAIPRVSRDQARAGEPVAREGMRAGDLVFFSAEPNQERVAHVGLLLENGELVHASSGQGEVVVARMGARWFQERFVGARRVFRITPTSTDAVARADLVEPRKPDAVGVPPGKVLAGEAKDAAPRLTAAPVTELTEHAGADALPIMLRRPAMVAPSYGPDLSGRRKTALGARALFVTEGEEFGLTIVPEASLFVPSIALEVALALPIRMAFGSSPTIGEVKAVRDVARFVRAISLGLRGADLELRLSQLGDAQLLSGLVVDKVAPSVLASGVPGLSVGRTPLTFVGALRTDLGSVETLVDDIFEPALVGAAVRANVLAPLTLALGAATDQRAQTVEGRRAINAMEAEVAAQLTFGRTELSAQLGTGAIFALDRQGGLGVARANLEHRFGDGAYGVRVGIRGGWLGRRTLNGLFGATYLSARPLHLEVLSSAGSRPMAGAEVGLSLGKLTLGALFEDGFSDDRVGFDRRVEAIAELDGIPLGKSRLLDLRLVYASRGAGRVGPTEHVLHGSARVRLTGWLRLEGYIERSQRTDGGAGAAVALEL